MPILREEGFSGGADLPGQASPSRDTEETGRGADSGGERHFFSLYTLFKLFAFRPHPQVHLLPFQKNNRSLENTLGEFLLLSIFMAGNLVPVNFSKSRELANA